MKASDLIGSKVYDAGGEFVGHCFDIEATRTGAVVSKSFGRALEVTGLLVGSGAAVQRLGFIHRKVRGPIGLRWLAGRLNSYRIPWDQLASVEHRHLRLACSKSDLKPLDRKRSG
jgi:sporulation protein YlmC with PRC-barrel domain